MRCCRCWVLCKLAGAEEQWNLSGTGPVAARSGSPLWRTHNCKAITTSSLEFFEKIIFWAKNHVSWKRNRVFRITNLFEWLVWLKYDFSIKASDYKFNVERVCNCYSMRMDRMRPSLINVFTSSDGMLTFGVEGWSKRSFHPIIITT